jgi:hypothetical protein
MIDPTYLEALEATEPPHRVLLGPVPCKRCGAWVEYAGVELLALGTAQPHDCEPFLSLAGLHYGERPAAEVMSLLWSGRLHEEQVPQQVLLMPWWADRLALAALVVAVVGVAAVAALALLPRS